MINLPLGLVIKLEDGLEESIRKVHDLGLPTCQLSTYEPGFFTADYAERIKELCATYHVRITALWAGWPGRVVWDFIEGPETVGLVPLQTRRERCEIMRKAADFALLIGVNHIVTHVGFVPEWPLDPLYPELVTDLREIAEYCHARDLLFCFETGQETPVTLLRLIEDIGSPNLGINYDPANLILYGKGNPVDALGSLGSYITGVHLKDGCYPTNGRELGEEQVLGQGQVNIPQFLTCLLETGYRGPLTIERETTGQQQIEDIKKAKEYLRTVI